MNHGIRGIHRSRRWFDGKCCLGYSLGMSQANRVIRHEGIYDWSPVGRGKELLFYATEHELETWVKQGLPQDGQMYQIIGFQTLEVTMNGFVQKGFVRNISEPLIQYREDGTPRDCFICSRALTPELELPHGSHIAMICNLNGLILIQCWINFKGPVMVGPATLRFIEEVEHDDTGEKVCHPGYARIFESICQEIDKHMAYTTCTLNNRGKIKLKHPEIKMSQAMAELCRSGEHKFVHHVHEAIRKP
jgi:hypothetical protein